MSVSAMAAHQKREQKETVREQLCSIASLGNDGCDFDVGLDARTCCQAVSALVVVVLVVTCDATKTEGSKVSSRSESSVGVWRNLRRWVA